jgi:hypothetical protein
MAGEQWFYAKGGQQQGPVDSAALEQMLRLGSLSGADLVWREGMAQWLPASTQPEIYPAAQRERMAAQPGAQQAAWPQPQAQAAGPHALSYGGYQGYGAPEYAGFWLRFAAWVIDFLINAVAGFFVGMILAVVIGFATVAGAGSQRSMASSLRVSNWVAGTIISWLYYAFMESSSAQGTVGKMAVSIKVTDMEGNRFSLARATGRLFA